MYKQTKLWNETVEFWSKQEFLQLVITHSINILPFLLIALKKQFPNCAIYSTASSYFTVIHVQRLIYLYSKRITVTAAKLAFHCIVGLHAQCAAKCSHIVNISLNYTSLLICIRRGSDRRKNNAPRRFPMQVAEKHQLRCLTLYGQEFGFEPKNFIPGGYVSLLECYLGILWRHQFLFVFHFMKSYISLLHIT